MEETYTFDSPLQQSFSLPQPLITYIIKQPSSLEGYKKLQKSCKYIFGKGRIILAVYSLPTFLDDFIYFNAFFLNFGVAVQLNANAREWQVYNKGEPVCRMSKAKFWINRICFGRYENSRFPSPNFIYRCSLRDLEIRDKTLTLDELNFLLEHNKIRQFMVSNANIRDRNGNPATVDTIYAKTPNVSSFVWENKCEIYCNETLERLNLIEHPERHLTMFYLHIHSIKGDIAPELFETFFTKNGIIFPGTRRIAFFLYLPADVYPRYKKYFPRERYIDKKWCICVSSK